MLRGYSASCPAGQFLRLVDLGGATSFQCQAPSQQRFDSFAQSASSSCGCQSSNFTSVVCCKGRLFGQVFEDPIGCFNIFTFTITPSSCGTNFNSVAQNCSCSAPAVSVTCPNLGGTQGPTQLLSCVFGGFGGGDTCNGVVVTASGFSSGSTTFNCDCTPGSFLGAGSCGVSCPNTVFGNFVSGSALSSRALCGRVL